MPLDTTHPATIISLHVLPSLVDVRRSTGMRSGRGTGRRPDSCPAPHRPRRGNPHAPRAADAAHQRPARRTARGRGIRSSIILPVTGERPMKFAAKGLPDGLTIDPATGNVTGTATERGTHPVEFTATNARGTDKATINLVIGDTICLTPPLGWNSWNHFAATSARPTCAPPPMPWSPAVDRPRLDLREHRRLLAGRARCGRQHPRQREVPRPQGAGRLHPRARG